MTIKSCNAIFDSIDKHGTKTVRQSYTRLPEVASILEALDFPVILLSANYQILAHNRAYASAFGEISPNQTCFQVSHGYKVPCDQAGEECPLNSVQKTQQRERILHIHQTKNGEEHIEIEVIPVLNDVKETVYFLELIKPIPYASGHPTNHAMVGNSPAFIKMLDRITRVGKSDASVLLLGESGTGKELAAKAVHQYSPRKNKALITLECSGLTDSLFESELFGHVKGAFTGANTTKKGLVELAHGGTLFLDEIADVPMSMQVKLLRLLEHQTFRAVGSTEAKRSDFRLICATHKNIKKLVEEEKFRLDLFHRINVFPIQLPALKERIDDIPLIAKSLLKQLEPEHSYHLTEKAIKALQTLSLDGNIRELRNILNRAIVLADRERIDTALIEECLESDSQYREEQPTVKKIENGNSWVDLKTLENEYLTKVHLHFDKDVRKTAQVLGISVRSLYRKIQARTDMP